MKKSIATLLALTMCLTTLFAKPILTIDKDDMNKVHIFNEYGEIVENATSLDSSGYMIHTKDEITATSDFGDIALSSNSLFAVTSIEDSSAYLVFGEARITLNDTLAEPLSIYTPTTLTKLQNKGEYVFISLDDEEKFYNLSSYTVSSYNAIDGKSYDIESLKSIDYLTRSNLISIVTRDTYQKLSNSNSFFAYPTLPSLLVDSQELNPENHIDNKIKAIIPVPAVNVNRALMTGKEDNAISTAPYITRTVTTELGDILLVADGSSIKITHSRNITTEQIESALALIDTQYDYSIDDNTFSINTLQDNNALEKTEAALVAYFANLAPVKEEPAKEESAPTIKSAISSSEAKRSFSFDIRLSTRAFTDSSNNQSLSTSVIPEFSYGAFKLAFNLDPISIFDYEANDGWQDWLGYSINFIDTLQYRTMNEVFSIAIDRTSKIEGDLLGLYDGVDHIWDKEYQALGLMMNIDTSHFIMDVYFNDLTFGRYAIENNTDGVAGFNMGYIVSDKIPVAFKLGMLINIDYTNASKAMIYPEAEFFIPFYNRGYNKAGLSFVFASAMDIDNNLYNPSKSGFIFGAKIPMEFYGLTANAGIYYTNPGEGTSDFPIHYRGINNPRYSNLTFPENDTVLTLAGNIGYSGSIFGLDVAMLGDITTSTMKAIDENSLLEVSTYLSFNGVTLKGGISMQDFTNGDKYKENAKLYTGLDLDIGGVATSLKVGIDNIEDKDFFISFGASASFLGKREDRADNPIKIPFSFGITTGYEYRYEDEASRYLIIPTMTIGKDNLALSLRAPFLLTFDTDSKEFNLAGLVSGRTWWDFGSSEEGKKKVFYAITDAMQMINYISIGNPETSVAYINAQRDFLMSDTLFTAFGTDNELSLRAGFNFYNLSLGVYGGNVENPHIAELKIGIYPVNQDSISLDFSVPAEFYIEDTENFDLFFYPEVRLNLPLFKKHFNVAIYTVGSVSAEYENGEPATTSVVYDFENKRLFAALLGGEIGLDWSSFSIKLQGGWRTGPLTPDMYNVFTSTYNQKPSIIASEDESSYDSSYYAKAIANFSFKPLELEMAYSVRDVEKLINDYKNINEDIFSLKMKVNFNESISLYGAFHRKGFVSLFQDGTDFIDDVLESANTIYSLGMDFDYGIVSVNAEYSSLLKSSGFQSSDSNKYVNVNPEYISDTISSSFSVTTRIKF